MVTVPKTASIARPGAHQRAPLRYVPTRGTFPR
jgi:hypothetical protein